MNKVFCGEIQRELGNGNMPQEVAEWDSINRNIRFGANKGGLGAASPSKNGGFINRIIMFGSKMNGFGRGDGCQK